MGTPWHLCCGKKTRVPYTAGDQQDLSLEGEPLLTRPELQLGVPTVGGREARQSTSQKLALVISGQRRIEYFFF